jgi:hypothetical protein
MKKTSKNEAITKGEMATMLGTLTKTLDLRFSRVESYMKQGFENLDNKIEHIDERLSQNITGLNRRVDDLAENKIAKVTYKELEHRVGALEKRVFKKITK